MWMWGAGIVVAAVQALTKDKMPVTDLFLSGGPGYRTEPRLSRRRALLLSRHCCKQLARRRVLRRGEKLCRPQDESLDSICTKNV